MSYPHHGIPITVDTAQVPRTICAQLSQETLQRLVDVYEETGQQATAARAAGLSRRMACSYLNRLGIARRAPALLRQKSTYTHPVTGRTVRSLYALGTVRRAVDLYERSELSTQEIARRTGVPRDTVHNWMEKLGIARTAAEQQQIGLAHRLGFASRGAMVAEIRRLRVEHDCTVEEIARALGTHRRNVSAVLARGRTARGRRPEIMRRAGRERRVEAGRPAYAYKPGGNSDPERRAERRRQVLACRGGGMSPDEIAARFDVSISTIYNDLRDRRAA